MSSSLTLILPKSTSTGLLLFIWHGGIIIVPVMLIGISTAHKSDKKERNVKEGANKRGNSSRLTQSFHFFMFEPIF
ncbi:hypothetical protein, partial [Escherichia coli]